MRDARTHPGRKSIRLPQIDYSLPGMYFVTVVTQNRTMLFGKITDSEMKLNDAGRMILDTWSSLPARFNQASLDLCFVMPNHLHGIIIFHPPEFTVSGAETEAESGFNPATGKSGCMNTHEGYNPHGTALGSLARVIQEFKSLTTNLYINRVRELGWRKFAGRLWQRNYYEQIIRDEQMLNEIREYILTNPLRWELDKENQNRVSNSNLH